MRSTTPFKQLMIEGYTNHPVMIKQRRTKNFKHENYLSEKNNYAICTIRGAFLLEKKNLKREPDRKQFNLNARQEDAISGAVLTGFNQLSHDARKSALNQTVTMIQDKYGNTKEVGSTLCSLIAWMNPDTKKLIGYTTNVGNSFACFVIIGIKGNVRHISVLNTQHINKKRAADSIQIAISHAIGHRSEEKHHLSHKPEVKRHIRGLKKGDQVFAIVASDGLTTTNNVYNQPALTIKQIGTVIKQNRRLSLLEIAEALVNSAFKSGRGSTDNISVGVIAINENPTSITVADGHGGIKLDDRIKIIESGGLVAENICQNFYPILQKRLKASKLLRR